MAAYDEVQYQLGQHADECCCVSGVCDDHAAVNDAFFAGVRWERARITEELALNCELVALLLVHGEWPRRTSFYRWDHGDHAWQRAQEIRAEARELPWGRDPLSAHWLQELR